MKSPSRHRCSRPGITWLPRPAHPHLLLNDQEVVIKCRFRLGICRLRKLREGFLGLQMRVWREVDPQHPLHPPRVHRPPF